MDSETTNTLGWVVIIQHREIHPNATFSYKTLLANEWTKLLRLHVGDSSMDMAGRDFFNFLDLQITEERIVEDELDLAKLAALVPLLCDALRATLKDTDAGASALAKALAVTAEVVRAA